MFRKEKIIRERDEEEEELRKGSWDIYDANCVSGGRERVALSTDPFFAPYKDLLPFLLELNELTYLTNWHFSKSSLSRKH